MSGFEFTTLVVIGTDCTGSCKSNYHTITTTTAPIYIYMFNAALTVDSKWHELLWFNLYSLNINFRDIRWYAQIPKFNAPRKPNVITEAMCAAGTAYPPGAPKFTSVLSGVCVARSLVVYVMFCSSVFVPLSFIIWPFWCLYFFNLRLLVALFCIFKLFLWVSVKTTNVKCHLTSQYPLSPKIDNNENR